MVGIGVVTWEFVVAAAFGPAEDVPIAPAGGGAAAWGYIKYRLSDAYAFEGDVLFMESHLREDELCIEVYNACSDLGLVTRAGNVSDFIAATPDAPFQHLLSSSQALFERAFLDEPSWSHVLPLRGPLSRIPFLFNTPKLQAVKYWRKEAVGGQRREVRVVRSKSEECRAIKERIALELPGAKRKRNAAGADDAEEPAPVRPRKDPVKLLFGLDFCKYLKATENFSAAGTAWESYKCGEQVAPRPKGEDPAKVNLQRARQRLSIVTLLIERRNYHGALAAGEIRAINLYTDASPIVGVELQGIVLDICWENEEVHHVVMPCGTLHYGRCGALNKTATFLWSMWLVFGPDISTLRMALNKVRCVTTDFGTEMKTLDAPDMLKAFMARLQGHSPDICRGLVDPRQRLLPFALRLSGWSHLWGNLMKAVAKSNPSWPAILESARDLCRFFGWRAGGSTLSVCWTQRSLT